MHIFNSKLFSEAEKVKRYKCCKRIIKYKEKRITYQIYEPHDHRTALCRYKDKLYQHYHHSQCNIAIDSLKYKRNNSASVLENTLQYWVYSTEKDIFKCNHFIRQEHKGQHRRYEAHKPRPHAAKFYYCESHTQSTHNYSTQIENACYVPKIHGNETEPRKNSAQSELKGIFKRILHVLQKDQQQRIKSLPIHSQQQSIHQRA